jgi:hypothetical protein
MGQLPSSVQSGACSFERRWATPPSQECGEIEVVWRQAGYMLGGDKRLIVGYHPFHRFDGVGLDAGEE